MRPSPSSSRPFERVLVHAPVAVVVGAARVIPAPLRPFRAAIDDVDRIVRRIELGLGISRRDGRDTRPFRADPDPRRVEIFDSASRGPLRGRGIGHRQPARRHRAEESEVGHVHLEIARVLDAASVDDERLLGEIELPGEGARAVFGAGGRKGSGPERDRAARELKHSEREHERECDRFALRERKPHTPPCPPWHRVQIVPRSFRAGSYCA